MDDISVEEQQQIDLAIQLSLGGSLKPAAAHERHVATNMKAPIIIDDSSSEEESEDFKHGGSAQNGSDTELSEDEKPEVAKESRVLLAKRKADEREESLELSSSKKVKTDSVLLDTDSSNASSVTNSSLPSRADMEKERLARVAARLAKEASAAQNPMPSHSKPSAVSSAPRIATLSSITQPDEAPVASTSGTSAAQSSTIASLSTLATPENNNNRRFWNGELRPTGSSRHTGYDCFRFEDIIGNTDDLQSALLSTFCGEPDWVYSHFPSHVRVALVQPCREHQNLEVIQVAENMQLINPKREAMGHGVMHIKLFLLYYTDRLRVAVSTANLVSYDFASIENAVYVHDFPRMAESSSPQASSPFLTTLIRTHKSLGTPVGLYRDALTSFDYSSATNVRLVLSLPGTHSGEAGLHANGHTALAYALQELRLDTPFKGAELSLECQGSSIGNYTLDWMRGSFRSAMGWDQPRSGIVSDSSRKSSPFVGMEWPNVKVVYPTLQRVLASHDGPRGGGTLFCPMKYWTAPKFPRHLFHDSISKRDGLLQHTKMIVGMVKPSSKARPTPFAKISNGTSKSTKDEERSSPKPAFKPFGWLYIGSHNFTPAAWGRYSEKSGNINIANHELGIILPLRSDDPEAEASRLVTWRRPLVRYTPKDQPWDQTPYHG